MKNHTPTRPEISEAGLLKAAKIVAESIVRWGIHADLNSARLAQDIVAQYNSSMNGYVLASNLDRHCGYQPDAEMVESLDTMSGYVDSVYKKEIQQWVIDLNVEPPFPEETPITIGLIKSVSTYHPACYEVLHKSDDKDSGRRLIVKFEDAVYAGEAA